MRPSTPSSRSRRLPSSRFAFTQKHNVLLPSSYQTLLQTSLQPYHAIPPQEMVRRAKMVEGFRETFVLDIKGGDRANVTVVPKEGREEQWPGTDKRATDLVGRI